MWPTLATMDSVRTRLVLGLWLAAWSTGCTQPTTDPTPAAGPSSPTTSSTMAPPEPPTPSPAAATAAAEPASKAIATLGNGCFWCTEAVLEQLDGVLDVTSGYMGGAVDRPTYQQVCTGDTGHAEVVQVTYDPSKIRYEDLLDWFFRSHDPTTLNRQGADVGTQYRSVIFTHDDEQKRLALEAVRAQQPNFNDPIVTEITPAATFWPAERYHQDYFRTNPGQGYCRMVIAPKLKKLGLESAPK